MRFDAGAYRKGIAAAGTVAAVFAKAAADGQLTSTEVGDLVLAVIGAIVVVAVRNDTEPAAPRGRHRADTPDHLEPP